ncbi:MAG: hypothetical protein HC927_02835 [Deltaproteobacteria bacterium]|nr:hypothetical protein [Deltaproteobacteria bacterium]
MLNVCLRAHEVTEVEPGRRVLLRVRKEDLDWLNLARPIFATRELRTILWADDETFDAMMRRAPDFHDWISRTVEVPAKAVPDFAVAGLSAALEVGAEVSWRGEGLHESISAAGGKGAVVETWVGSYRELVIRLQEPGLHIISGVHDEELAWQVRMARAHGGHTGTWIAQEPFREIVGMWPLHAEQLDWDEATAMLHSAGWARPALLAAWLELEPERIDEAIKCVNRAPRPTSDWKIEQVTLAGAPPRVLRERAREHECRALRERLRSQQAQPEQPAARVLWSEGSSPWQGEDGVLEPRLVRALRELGDRTPTTEFVKQVLDAGFEEVAVRLVEDRWNHGVDQRADELVAMLVRFEDLAAARKIVDEWLDRAANDEESFAAASRWLATIESNSPAMFPAIGDESAFNLLNRWRSGDKHAGDLLLNFYYNKLRRYFQARGYLDDDTTSLIVETMSMLGAVGSISSKLSPHDFQSFEPFLYATARVALSNWQRLPRPRARFVKVPAQLSDMLQELPDDDLELLLLKYEDGLPLGGIAEALQTSIPTVVRRIHRIEHNLPYRVPADRD